MSEAAIDRYGPPTAAAFTAAGLSEAGVGPIAAIATGVAAGVAWVIISGVARRE